VIRVCSLASGSGGNALLVEAAGERLLVDCGLAPRELARRLARVGRAAGDLTGLVLTHEHGDHVRGAAEVALAGDLPVYGTAGTLRVVVMQAARVVRASREEGPEGPRLARGERSRLARLARPVAAGEPARAGGLTLRPVGLLHDAREPVAYVLEAEGVRVAVCTDLGRATPEVAHALAGVDLLVLEFNHDATMLAGGPYHPSLKRRVSGDRGHLSNAQAADLLGTVAWPGLQAVWLAHLSQVNNRPPIAREAARGALRRKLPFESVRVACLAQDEVRPWEAFAARRAAPPCEAAG
jgi:phosphoribosyl 1,2-cyclic phosphodiesterase